MALVEEVVKAMHLSSEEEMEGLRQVQSYGVLDHSTIG